MDKRQIERLEGLGRWIASFSGEMDKISDFPIHLVYELRKSGILVEEIRCYFNTREEYKNQNFREMLEKIIEAGEYEFQSSSYYRPSRN